MKLEKYPRIRLDPVTDFIDAQRIAHELDILLIERALICGLRLRISNLQLSPDSWVNYKIQARGLMN